MYEVPVSKGRKKKYRPQHRKRKMLLLRRGIKDLTPEKIFIYLNNQVKDDSIARFRIRGNTNDYAASDVRRVIFSVHKKLVKRYLDLTVFW